ncbi:RNA-binding protein 7 [Sergentomyia squamirostris]
MDDSQPRTLFCGNLSDKVTEEILYELFLQAGPIEEVKIPKSRSFGFITYRHVDSIDYALKLYTGTRLYGREIKVSLKSNGPGCDRDRPGNSHDARLDRMGLMMPQLNTPPQILTPAMFGCTLNMQQLMDLGQQLNANLPEGFSSSSRGDFYGDNRSRDLVSRDKHYRNHDSKKPYGNHDRRQRDIEKERSKNPGRNNNYRARDRPRRR